MSGSHGEAKADACVEAGLVVSKMCCFGPYSEDPIDQRVWEGADTKKEPCFMGQNSAKSFTFW